MLRQPSFRLLLAIALGSGLLVTAGCAHKRAADRGADDPVSSEPAVGDGDAGTTEGDGSTAGNSEPPRFEVIADPDQPESSTGDVTVTEGYDINTMLAAVILDPPFPTGDYVLYKGHAACRPIQACTILEARAPNQDPIRIRTSAELVAMFPPTDTQMAVNLVGFLLNHPHAFDDVNCTLPPEAGDAYELKGIDPPVAIRPMNLHMNDDRWGIRVVELCWDRPDRLVLVEEILGPDGSYERVELEELATGDFLPRFY